MLSCTAQSGWRPIRAGNPTSSKRFGAVRDPVEHSKYVCLPNRYVIHALGPRYEIDDPSDELLANAYRNALSCCREYGLESVGFPAISAGAFGFPLEAAARIAVETVKSTFPEGLKVRFVLFDSASRNAFAKHVSED